MNYTSKVGMNRLRKCAPSPLSHNTQILNTIVLFKAYPLHT